MARTQDVTIYRGEAISFPGTIYTTDTGSTPEDITGWTLAMTVADDNNPSTTKRITKACTLTVAASGTFAAAVTSAETNLEPGTYYYDVTRTDSGYVRTLVSGKFIVLGVPRLPSA